VPHPETAVRFRAFRPDPFITVCLALSLAPAVLSAADSFDPGVSVGMPGMLGAYSMSREASGTSWQPDSTPMIGLHDMGDRRMTMWGGYIDLIHDDQGGPRGGTRNFASGMLMFMDREALTHGALGLRLMVSADPLMGKAGYPELFQTGETADGVLPLVNRQHPHNLLMEAAVTYSADVSAQIAIYGYAGLAGEPALGPPAFMHRISGMDNPEAPLTHHWLDSTHVTYGVTTAGLSWDRIKIEASAFNGREPDQHRYAVELRGFDSHSVRVSYNPVRDLALQWSEGRLASPEQLEPNVAVRRSTASASYNYLRADVLCQTTLAWGRNEPRPALASTAWLLESAVIVSDVHTVFGRAERVAKDELFEPGQPYFGRPFTINSLSLGYIYDFAHVGPVRAGLGALITVYRYPTVLDAAYGAGPVSSLVFLRARL